MHYEANKRRQREERKRRKLARRRKLMAIAQHNNAVYKADNPRDVPPLQNRDLDVFDSRAEKSWLFRDRVTGVLQPRCFVAVPRPHTVSAGQVVRVVGSGMSAPSENQPMKVVGVPLDIPGAPAASASASLCPHRLCVLCSAKPRPSQLSAEERPSWHPYGKRGEALWVRMLETHVLCSMLLCR